MKWVKIVSFSLFVITAGIALDQGGLFDTVLPAATPLKSKTKINTAPDFTLKTWRGESFALSSQRGKIILLNFWASWCAPCLKEFPWLIDLVRESRGEMVLVAVSNDEDREEMNAFIRDLMGRDERLEDLLGSQVHILWDGRREVSHRLFNVLSLPETFILNRELQIMKKVVGAEDWTTPELKAFLNKAWKSIR